MQSLCWNPINYFSILGKNVGYHVKTKQLTEVWKNNWLFCDVPDAGMGISTDRTNSQISNRMENTSWQLSSLKGFFVQDIESYICHKGKKKEHTDSSHNPGNISSQFVKARVF